VSDVSARMSRGCYEKNGPVEFKLNSFDSLSLAAAFLARNLRRAGLETQRLYDDVYSPKQYNIFPLLHGQIVIHHRDRVNILPANY